jgi:hypothetical protein
MNMHRLLGRVLLTVPMVAMAMPAQASLDLLANITKDKDIFVTERIQIDKNIKIDVKLDNKYEGAAEADALSNQLNENNIVAGNIKVALPPADKLAYGIKRDALIQNSVNANKGIVGVNQDVGNMVNQANVVAVALTTSKSAFTNSQAEADQINRNNQVTQLEQLQGDPKNPTPDRTAEIRDSINFNSGVVGVNQNAGNMNNQLNKLALAVGEGAKVALSEAALGQVNTGNKKVTEVNTVKTDLISGSGSNNSGIVGINQSSGNMNNQASVVSMAVLTSKVAITTP